MDVAVPKKSTMAAIGEYTSLAMVLPVSTLVGGGIGYLIDRGLHTHFLWIIFGFAGTAGGIIEVMRQLQRSEKQGPE
jgi:F0F1-type ATP synthase assembly protein I